MADWSKQRYWEDVTEGEEVPSIAFPISLVRLVVEAGANRDFNSIHHNSEYARATGAAEAYANNVFLQGMWERTVREYIGLAGTIRRVGPFRMRSFNAVGDTVVVHGTVKRKWEEDGHHLVELEMRSENAKGISVGPGPVLVALPSRDEAGAAETGRGEA